EVDPRAVDRRPPFDAAVDTSGAERGAPDDLAGPRVHRPVRPALLTSTDQLARRPTPLRSEVDVRTIPEVVVLPRVRRAVVRRESRTTPGRPLVEDLL